MKRRLYLWLLRLREEMLVGAIDRLGVRTMELEAEKIQTRARRWLKERELRAVRTEIVRLETPDNLIEEATR